MSSSDISGLVQRLEQVTNRLEQYTAKHTGSGGQADNEMSNPNSHVAVSSYDDLLNSDLRQFMELSHKIGGDLTAMADMVQEAFKAQRQFIVSALSSSKPGNSEQLSQQLQPTSNKINEITKYRESKRTSPLFNHLSTISESIGALGWVCQEPAPGPHVKEMLAASQFYSNRVLKDYKEKDATHAEWVKAWTAILNNLQSYIKAHHTTGLTWGVLGKKGSSNPSASAAGAPPPPPPLPKFDTNSEEKSETGGAAALFAQLNQGDKVTSHLKHVSKEMKQQGKKQPPPTAPKPNVGASNGASRSQPAAAAAPSKAASGAPPRLELQGNKWIVENHRQNPNIVVSDTELKHTVYIYKCDGCTIQIKGKINSVVLDSCRKTGLVLEDLISALDVVNCQSVQTQIMGKVPTVNIDKTDGCMVYLSTSSKDAEIVTAKSSEMNILIPKPNGDYEEFAVPEQFRTRFDGKGLKTECSEKTG